MTTFTYKGPQSAALLRNLTVKKGVPFSIDDPKSVALARELTEFYTEGTPEDVKVPKRNAKS